MSKVQWSRPASRSFDRLLKTDRQSADMVLDSVNLLLRNPRPAGAQPYGKNWFRIRVGVYRVVYEIKSEKPVIISIEHVGRASKP